MENYDYNKIFNIEALKENSYNYSLKENCDRERLENKKRSYEHKKNNKKFSDIFSLRRRKSLKRKKHDIFRIEENLEEMIKDREKFIIDNMNKYKSVFYENESFKKHTIDFYDLLGKEKRYDVFEEKISEFKEYFNEFKINQNQDKNTLENKIRDLISFNKKGNDIYSGEFTNINIYETIDQSLRLIKHATLDETNTSKVFSNLDQVEREINNYKGILSKEIRRTYSNILTSASYDEKRMPKIKQRAK